MSKEIVYGIGGFCVNCNDTHDHPLNNIIEENEILNDPIQEEINRKRQLAINKLIDLGLTEEDINLIVR